MIDYVERIKKTSEDLEKLNDAIMTTNEIVTTNQRKLSKMQSEKTTLESVLKSDKQSLETILNAENKEKKKKNTKPTVSDHAVIRYIERVMGIDVETFKKNMLTDRVRYAMKNDAKSIKDNDCTYIINNNTIVTILDKKGCTNEYNDS